MTVLADKFIKAMADSRGLIAPFSDESLTPNGYDLRVAEIVVDGESFKDGSVEVPPKTMFHLSSVEKVSLPDDYCAQLWIRSSWARKGVMASFGKVDAGFEGTLTFCAYNASNGPVTVSIGDRFCQICFEMLNRPAQKAYAKRSGHYQQQLGVTFSKE